MSQVQRLLRAIARWMRSVQVEVIALHWSRPNRNRRRSLIPVDYFRMLSYHLRPPLPFDPSVTRAHFRVQCQCRHLDPELGLIVFGV